MKTRLLILIGIIVIGVATSLILLTNYEQFTNQSDSGHFNYYEKKDELM